MLDCSYYDGLMKVVLLQNHLWEVAIIGVLKILQNSLCRNRFLIKLQADILSWRIFEINTLNWRGRKGIWK